MLKILIVIGTRPEAIKMAPVIIALKNASGMRPIVCITAQHRGMLDQVLAFFKIIPDYDLNIMQQNQSLNDTSGRILIAMEPVLNACKPDIVLVHGDTNTSFAAALSAFYKRIPIGHVEAGMRTGDLTLPFPEEGNRVLTTQIANIHFAPTALNVANLKANGVKKINIIKTGNTVIDSLLFAAKTITGLSNVETNNTLQLAIAEKKKIILVTGHRRENIGSGLKEICLALKEIAQKNDAVQIVFPVHLNPKVNEPVVKLLGKQKNILLTNPLTYPDFIYLMKQSYLILTDSGGIQEEGPSLGKPVLVMRDKTERPEAIKAGTVKLVGTNRENIVKAVQVLLYSPLTYHKMSKKLNPYGDGKAAERITNWLIKNAAKIKKMKRQ